MERVLATHDEQLMNEGRILACQFAVTMMIPLMAYMAVAIEGLLEEEEKTTEDLVKTHKLLLSVFEHWREASLIVAKEKELPEPMVEGIENSFGVMLAIMRARDLSDIDISSIWESEKGGGATSEGVKDAILKIILSFLRWAPIGPESMGVVDDLKK